MRIGIIGLGHIGLPLASFLHDQQHEVFSWTRKKRLVNWSNSNNLNSLDLTDLDVLIIASGAARPGSGDISLEMSSTLDLLNRRIHSPSEKVIYVSSGAVYGECSIPAAESDQPNPSTDYGRVKLAAEQRFEQVYGDKFISLRVGNLIDSSNPYGILQNLSKAVREKAINLYGLPTDCRDFMGVTDFLFAVEALLQVDEFPNVLNIGSGRSVELRELEEILLNNSKNHLSVSWKERRTGDLAHTRLDISFMQKLLKVNPANPLDLLLNFVSEINLTSQSCD